MKKRNGIPYVRQLLPLQLLGFLLLLQGCSDTGSKDGTVAEVGGSIARYAEQTYQTASWERVWDAESLLSRSGADPNLRLSNLQHISGTNADNLWIADQRGYLFQKRDGHWSYHGQVTGGESVATLRAVSPDVVAVGLRWFRTGPALIMVTPEGTRRYDTDQPSYTIRNAHIAVIAGDFLDAYYAGSNLGGVSFRLLSGEFSPLRPDRERASLLHREDNTPVADYPVHAIMHTATIQPRTEAYAFWRNPIGAGRRGGATAEFRDGIWVLRDQIQQDLSRVRTVWFGRGDGGVFMIAVGTGGFVLRQVLGGDRVEQPLAGSMLTATSGDLIAVWGRGPDDYFVMDSNGQIWKREDHQWRTVVRGLYDDDVLFNAAYVAPDGSVYALTGTSLYRLNLR